MTEPEYGLFEAPLLWVMFCWMANVEVVRQPPLGVHDGWYSWDGGLVKIVSGHPRETSERAQRPVHTTSQPIIRQFSIYDTIDYGESL